jgi:CO/xanthine dehydrogenase Mo-binding subunit
MAAALANALQHAMGLRVRDLPLTPEHIAGAIDQGSAASTRS